METASIKFNTIDEYYATFPKDIQDRLQEIRVMIREAAPDASEVISYNMPAFKQHGVLVYYAGYKGHIGFYPTAAPMTVFKDRLTEYKTSKGAIRFPLDKAIPKELVQDIVKFRVSQDQDKAGRKKGKK